ncbi:MAG TPA: DUF4241 domain-containing protein [Pyrinomonadaceae bacterium]|jgi:hypothetical protein
MKPYSNLDAVLQDGYSFRNMPNYGRPDVQDATISTHQIGELIVPSGEIIACDPLIGPDTRYYFKKTVTPGHYPVIVSVANFQPSGESRFACAMLRISDKSPVRWEVASINEPNTNQTEDRISYSVDAGTGCFMDLDAAQVLEELTTDADEFESCCDRILAEMDKHSFGKYRTAGWVNMRVSDDIEGNIITFSSGWGDGGYASFWGYDAAGKLTSLVTDFALFPDNGAA